MSGMFGGSSDTSGQIGLPPAPIKPPTIDDARLKQQQSDNLLARKGRAASMLTGPQGIMPSPNSIGTKKLLGN